MALAPLVVQTPRVSLIGGKELPKATGEGVRAPDLSSAFNQLTNELSRQDEINRSETDKVAGQVEMEQFINANIGKDPLGFYKRMPKIEGSPYYVAAATNTLEQNFKATLLGDSGARLGAIQAEVGVPTADKLARMASYSDGVIEQLPPELKTQAKTFLATDLDQRRNQLLAEDYRRNQAAMLDGIQDRINDATSKGISAASAGSVEEAAKQVNTAQQAVDEKVKLGVMTPEAAELQKERIRTGVFVAGAQDRIARATMAGDIDPLQLLDFANSLDVGGNVNLNIHENDVPGARIHEELLPTTIEISSEKLRGRIDEQLAAAVSQDLRQLANSMLQDFRRNDDRMVIADYLKVDHTNTNDQLPETVRSAYDKMVDEILRTKGGLDDPDARAAIVQMTLQTRQITPSLVQALENRMLGTIEQAQDALQIWNMLTAQRQGQNEVGQIVKRSVPSEKQAIFDEGLATMRDIMSGTEADKAQAWRKVMNKLADKTNSIPYWKEQYKAGTGNDFDADARALFASEYGKFAMPPEFAQELDAAFRNSMSMTTNPAPGEILQKVWERLKDRYSASPIYTTGFARHAPFKNPEGYAKQRIGGVGGAIDEGAAAFGFETNENLWISDYVRLAIEDAHKTGRLFMGDDDELRPEFDEVLSAQSTRDLPLGTQVTIEPIPGNLGEGTQFTVNLVMPDGSAQQVEVLDEKSGKPVPMLIDPGVVLAQMNSRARAKAQADEFHAELGVQRQLQIYNQKFQTNIGLADVNALGTGAAADWLQSKIGMSDAEIENWVLTQPDEFQKKYSEGKTTRIDAYNKFIRRQQEQLPVIPEGTFVTPELLMTPKAAGKDVTFGAIRAIEQVLPDGTGGQFMLNTAIAESKMGTAPNTFRPVGDRGIFQVNDGPSAAFAEVKRRANIPGDPIAVAAARVERAFGISIANATRDDLEKPIVNAAFARLYYMRAPGPIPQDAQGQAELWKTHYNTELGSGTVESFLAVANTVLMPTVAYAGDAGDPGGPGMVTDMQGNAFPANFLATQPITQTSAQRLSGVFGKPLRITPHGGTQKDIRKATSQHHTGLAIDVYIGDYSEEDRIRLIATAIQMGYRAVGGYGAGDGLNTLHLDLRSSPGKGPNGLALWWRKRPGVDGDWTTGPRWFTEGIRQGMNARGYYGA